jgi:thymidylate synthase (FAD)
MSEGKATDEEGAELSAAFAEHYERSFALYQAALQKGVARELARIFLPGFALFYTWVAKTDAHNLMHFMDLRMGSHAQEEIRAYARAIYTEFFCLALPWTADAFEKYVLTKHKTAQG